jgi:hypothetical protein
MSGIVFLVRIYSVSVSLASILGVNYKLSTKINTPSN